MKDRKENREAFSIGKFASLTGIDKETIRFYRDKGLLHPMRQEGNGYTYYSVFDFMDLYSILKYRDMEMSVRQTGQLLQGENLDLYEDKLNQQIEELEEEIKRLHRKLFRIRNARAYLSHAGKQDKWIEYQEDGMALYTLWLREPLTESLTGLLTGIPGGYIGINIPLNELQNGPADGVYHSCIGVGISEPSVREYDYRKTEGMEYTTPGPVLKYYVRLKDPLHIKREDLEPLIAYSRREGYEFMDHTTGYLCGTEVKDKECYYYFMIRVRVRRRERWRSDS